VSRPKALDELKVVAEFRPEAAPNSVERIDGVAAKLQHDIKSMIGITALVEIAPAGRVERSIGKAKRVIDLRPKE